MTYALHRYREQRASIIEADLQSIEAVVPDCRTNAAEVAFQTLVGSWDEIKALQNQVFTLIETDKKPGVLFVWTKEDAVSA